MGYKLGNRNIDIPGKDVKKIASGKRGDIYKYRNVVLKVFPRNYDQDDVLDEETAKYLTGIPTDHILLPRKILYYHEPQYDINEFRGYSLRSLNKKGAKKRLINENTIDVVNNIKALENDVILLSRKGVLLNGVTPSNIIYNGDIFLTDPSRYSVLAEIDYDSLENLNSYQLHLLLSELIVTDAKKEGFSTSTIAKIRSLLKIKDDLNKSSDFFGDILEDNTNLKQLIKKL